MTYDLDDFHDGDRSMDNAVSQDHTWEERQEKPQDIDEWSDLKPILLKNLETEIDLCNPKKKEERTLIKRLEGIRKTVNMVSSDGSELLPIDLLDNSPFIGPFQLYLLLLESFSHNDITVVPDKFGLWCGLRLYKDSSFSLKGLQVPSSFKVLKPCTVFDQPKMVDCCTLSILSYLKKARFYSNIKDSFLPLLDKWNSFVKPLTEPRVDTKQTTLYGQVNLDTDRVNDYDSKVSVCTESYPYKKGIKPLRLIPPKEWFPKSVQSLSANQIVTVLPPTELEVFMLIIGRALVGPSGTVPVGYEDPIIHSSRTSGILKGSPGSGKSELINLLEKTMEVYGYSARSVRSFNERFGMGEIAEADLVMKDDTNNDDLVKLTKSSTFKSFVTSNPICAEKKGKDATYVRPRAAVIMAANDWNENNAYSTDEGNRSRIRILETTEPSMRDLMLKGISDKEHPWYGVDELSPKKLISHLAKKYQVDVAVIMGWFYRLCADHFCNSIRGLERIDKRLEAKLVTRIAANPIDSLVKALRLSSALAGYPTGDHLSTAELVQSLRFLSCIMYDCRTSKLLDTLREDWVSSYCEKSHLWSAFRDIRPNTVLDAYRVAQKLVISKNARGNPYTREHLIKITFEDFCTIGGIKVGQSPANFCAAWRHPSTKEEVKHLLEISKGITPIEVFANSFELPNVYTNWYNDTLTSQAIEDKRRETLRELS